MTSPSPQPAAPTVVPTREPEVEVRPRLLPPYNVILIDDDDHTYEYVIEMLGKIFGYPAHQGFGMAREVDTTGRCIVWTGALETAELRRDQIHAYGADPRIPRCRGSMTAVIEATDG